MRALNRRASQSTTQSYAEKDTSAVKKAALLVEPGLQKGGFGDIPEKEPEKQGGVGRGHIIIIFHAKNLPTRGVTQYLVSL